MPRDTTSLAYVPFFFQESATCAPMFYLVPGLTRTDRGLKITNCKGTYSVLEAYAMLCGAVSVEIQPAELVHGLLSHLLCRAKEKIIRYSRCFDVALQLGGKGR